MTVIAPQAVSATTLITLLAVGLLFVAGSSLASDDAGQSGGDAITTTVVARRDPQRSGRHLRAAGTASDTAILGEGLAAGQRWSINSSGLGDNLHNGSTQLPGACLNFPNAGDWLSFECQDCSQPFALSNAGGVEYNISFGSPNNDQYQANATLPDYTSVQLILQDSSGHATCNLTIGKVCSPNGDNTCTAASYFSNAPSNLAESSMDCRRFLSPAVAIGFRTLQDNLTLCIEALQRLPSTVVAEDAGPDSMPIPEHVNCWSDSPLPTNENGNYTNQNGLLEAWIKNNITTASSGQLYEATVGIDMPFAYPMKANNGSCSLIKNKYSSAIDSCAHNLACCVDTTEWEDNGPMLPALLADMCRTLIIPAPDNGFEQLCIGVVYLHARSLAFFKSRYPGSGPSIQLNLSNGGTTCNNPNGTVLWRQADAVPDYKPVPGIISPSIYNGSLQANWTILTTSFILPLIQQQGPAGGAPSSSTGLCINMTPQGGNQQADYDGFRFACQDCTDTNKPFAINETAGFKMRLSHANLAPDRNFTTDGTWPSQVMKLQLMGGLSRVLCNLSVINTGEKDTGSGMFWATALYQNNQQCIPLLGRAAKVQFLTQVIPTNGAFCLDDFQLLPSAFPTSSAVTEAAVTTLSTVPNCDASQAIAAGEPAPPYYAWPEPTDQEGNFTLSPASIAAAGVPQGNATGFSLLDGLAFSPIPPSLSFLSTNSGNCTIISGTATTQASLVPGPCCYNVTAFTGYEMGDSWLPQTLGDICNALWSPAPSLPSEGRWACQGFTFDVSTKISCFFGQNQQLKLDLNNSACKRPGAAIWALTAALPDNTLSDMRKPPSSGGGNSGFTVGKSQQIALHPEQQVYI
uniref:Putative extracellular protein TR9_095 n=1 Tax=Trebouxia lynnae TaxID=1825957 RepID=A0A7L9QEP6_9CHLO|nr:putative extracellular protein TR9_095 [Trebouxia lynnae]